MSDSSSASGSRPELSDSSSASGSRPELSDSSSASGSRPELSDSSSELTHLDEAGRARMVDVGAKDVTQRVAVAEAVLEVRPDVARLLADGALPKGDALPVARIAGIQAAKRTPELIPLCHAVALTSVAVDIAVDAEAGSATVTATARAADRTGVEMEALVAASVAALTLYDMVKAVQRDARVAKVQLLHKSGGVRGDYSRSEG